MSTDALKRLARILERAVIALACGALLFRLLGYGRFPRLPGMPWGTGDVIDLALAAAVFLTGLACAGCGVALSARVDERDRGMAWRSAVIGMTAFVVYYLVHPYVPVLPGEP